MKSKLLFMVILSVLFLSLSAIAQPAHPNGGSNPGAGNQPVGGGSAPLGGGVALLLTLASAYGARKITAFRRP
ncbi:MAG: hypothetical protein PHQ65_09535 [Bacteroidales bacterium]|nr:hypothetical protein [Bacteroidales bacterium]MDD3665491.1 hypothetical protein [Bacteroidales bacterium]